MFQGNRRCLLAAFREWVGRRGVAGWAVVVFESETMKPIWVTKDEKLGFKAENNYSTSLLACSSDTACMKHENS